MYINVYMALHLVRDAQASRSSCRGDKTPILGAWFRQWDAPISPAIWANMGKTKNNKPPMTGNSKHKTYKNAEIGDGKNGMCLPTLQ
jgi:hypothetical protein